MFRRYECVFYKRRCQARTMENIDITHNEMKSLVRKGAIIVDVRSPQEYREGHINGAMLIPDYEMYVQAKNLLPYKFETIILYCQNGTRSKKACNLLKMMGYTNVYNLANGIENY